MKKPMGLLLIIFMAAFFTACSSIVPPPASAEINYFTWKPSTIAENNNVITGPVFYRIFCDAEPPVEAGSDITEYAIKDSLPAATADGLHACNLTAHLGKPCPDMDTGVCESGRSNTVTFWKKGPVFFAGEEPVIGIFSFK